MQLPTLLAGPIVRRVEPRRVCIWLATSIRPSSAELHLWSWRTEDRFKRRLPRPERGDRISTKSSFRTVALAPKLFVTLIFAEPAGDSRITTLPVNQLIGYDIKLRSAGPPSEWTLASLLGEPLTSISYPGFSQPTFFIQHFDRNSGKGLSLRLLHGSCRKLTAAGEDASIAADHIVADSAAELARRPAILMLTGDQIYPDDVPLELRTHLNEISHAFLGTWETIRWRSQTRQLRDLTDTDRAQLGADIRIDAKRQLYGFGEFAAMYLLAWNEKLWPKDWPGLDDDTAEALERSRSALPKLRRLFANTPTYMIFDDHEITDGWNFNRRWEAEVYQTELGNQLRDNGLVNYWAFQGWGNGSSLHDDWVIKALESRPAAPGVTHALAIDWSDAVWSFSTETTPPLTVLDTRTRRTAEGGDPAGFPGLLNAAGLDDVRSTIAASGHRAGDTLLVVSAAPVFGTRRLERSIRASQARQEDAETWGNCPEGLFGLMSLLSRELRASRIVFLSGDRHYAFTTEAAYSLDRGQSWVSIAQCVSSGLNQRDQTIASVGELIQRRWLEQDTLEFGGNAWIEVIHFVKPLVPIPNVGLVSVLHGGVRHELFGARDGEVLRLASAEVALGGREP